MISASVYIPIATTLTVFLVGLYFTIRHFKIIRTVTYIERMNNPSMIKTRAVVDDWLQMDACSVCKLNRLAKDVELRTHLIFFYNILTELAIAYNYRLLHRRLAREIWTEIIKKYANRMGFYFRYYRERGEDIGRNLEKLATSLGIDLVVVDSDAEGCTYPGHEVSDASSGMENTDTTLKGRRLS